MPISHCKFHVSEVVRIMARNKIKLKMMVRVRPYLTSGSCMWRLLTSLPSWFGIALGLQDI